MSPRVFISYRREDAAGYAGRLHDALTERFGEENVLMDIGAIGAEQDVTQVVERTVESADVLIALIGPGWLQATDREGRRRLDMPNDSVRLEIERALRSYVPVIPALARGAHMPSAGDLPEPLRSLERRLAIELRDESWRYDVDRLIETLERWTVVEPAPPRSFTEPVPMPDRIYLPESEEPPRPSRFRRWLEARHQKKAGEDEVSSVEREVE
jgi:hypothetical protein